MKNNYALMINTINYVSFIAVHSYTIIKCYVKFPKHLHSTMLSVLVCLNLREFYSKMSLTSRMCLSITNICMCTTFFIILHRVQILQ